MTDEQIVDKLESMVRRSDCTEKNKAYMLEWLNNMALMCGAGRHYPSNN